MDFELVGSHSDVVNDIAFDYYGNRFATCSSDKMIRIWDLKSASYKQGTTRSNSSWKCIDIPRAHQNAIWRLR